MTENAYYYFFSTVAQTLAAMVAVFVAIYLVTMQRLRAHSNTNPFGTLTVLFLLLLIAATLTISGALVGILMVPSYLASSMLFVLAMLVGSGMLASLFLIIGMIIKAININITLHPTGYDR